MSRVPTTPRTTPANVITGAPTNARGDVIGRHHVLRSRPPVQYRFADLHASLTEYLDAVVTMLQKLSEIQILRR